MMELGLVMAVAGCLVLAPETERITAGDLAVVEPAFGVLPAGTVFGFAPLAGVRRVMSPGALAAFAARHSLPSIPPRELCAERAMTPLAVAAMREAMQRSLPGARIEIVDHVRHPVVPQGEMEFPRAGLGAPAAEGLAAWRGAVRYGGRQRFPLWARVRVWVERPRVVAAMPIAAGEVIEARHVRLELVEEFPSPAAWAHSLEQVVGRAPRRSVASGARLSAILLEAPKDIRRGDLVRVEARFGETLLALEARAEADGRVGDHIPMRNPASNRRFVARLEAKGRAIAIGSIKP